MNRFVLRAMIAGVVAAAAASSAPATAQQAEIETRRGAAQKWSDAEVADAVHKYLFDDTPRADEPLEFPVLESVRPERVHPILLKTLKDPALRERLVTSTMRTSPRFPPHLRSWMPESAVTRACALLGDAPPGEFAGVLTPFMDDKSTDVRRAAAGALGKIGTVETIPGLRKALVDDDEYVRSAAMLSLLGARFRERLQARVQSELFDDLRRYLSGKHYDGTAVELVLLFDRERALELLLTPEYFSPANPRLDDLLGELVSQNITVPRDQLLPIVESLERGDLDDDSKGRTFGLALTLLGRHRDPQDRRRIEGYASHANELLVWGSLKGLLAWHGLEDFDQRIRKTEAVKGKEALSPAQRHFGPVMELNFGTRYGGFANYFREPSGGRWREALAGLEFYGMKEQAAALRAAVELFGATPPSTDSARRAEQLEEVSGASFRPFEQMDDDFFLAKPMLTITVMRYVLEHPEAFR